MQALRVCRLKIVGGHIPRGFIAIDKGVQETMREGVFGWISYD